MAAPLSFEQYLDVLVAQFAWGCAFVLVEIVDCIDDKPVQRGRKAINAAYAMVAVILFAVGIATYGSVGDDAPGWFLNAFTTPEWLIILANIVRLHVLCVNMTARDARFSHVSP